MWFEPLLVRGLVPEGLVRWGIRRRLAARLRQESRGTPAERHERFRAFLAELRRSPIATHTADANRQHYEVPAAFFEQVLGRHLKYSAAYWPAGVDALDTAEEAMLDLCCERAQLADGQDVLDLGCGWGSLSLWIARRYPRSRVLAVSNSESQIAHVRDRAAVAGLANVAVRRVDAGALDLGRRFDRVVSVEMFEHMRNHERLLARVADHLRPDGRLFVHVFSHREHAYPYEVTGPDDWMAQHFFTGGIMPSDSLLIYCQRHLVLEDHWRLDGRHYGRTAEAWLANYRRHRTAVEPMLAEVYGSENVALWWLRWRLFFLAVAETWNYRRGTEWLVSHYRFAPRPAARTAGEQEE